MIESTEVLDVKEHQRERQGVKCADWSMTEMSGAVKRLLSFAVLPAVLLVRELPALMSRGWQLVTLGLRPLTFLGCSRLVGTSPGTCGCYATKLCHLPELEQAVKNNSFLTKRPYAIKWQDLDLPAI